ncbi:FAD/FMN-containing dehydrogenase [Streptomyces sp. 846.5]|nr:FAD-binding protein [Streptomyces sp. 846.5]TDU02192.1 FAD/FMN-containing dehydrogenase [Streptomyces sp. 846.5]
MVSRRSFIRLGATAAATAAATAVGASGALPAVFAQAAAPDWAGLAGRLSGPLVLPSDTNYATAKQIQWSQFDSVNPAAIAYCRSAADVSACLVFARANGLPATPRSGGHSFSGFSLGPGLVMDVSQINGVQLSGGTATVGGGALQIDVLNGLSGSGLALPGGLYPTVGSGGFIQGGGLGWETRLLGMACDTLLSAQVVLADGTVVTCSPKHDADLFWALRGGGGGNFGVVTSYSMAPTAVTTMTNFTLTWTWDQAADVLAGWQEWALDGPRQLSSGPAIALFDAAAGNVPLVSVAGVWMGNPAAAGPLLDALVALVGHAPASRTSADFSYTNGMLNWYGCSNLTVSQCHRVGTTGDGQLGRFGWSLDRSRLFSDPLPTAGIDALLAAFDANRTSGQSRFMRAIVLGGRANDLGRTDTAYVHRDSQFIVSFDIGLPSATPSVSDQSAAQAWATGGFNAVDPYSNRESYVNYLDPLLADWSSAYYAENYPRLQRVKACYDPTNFFRFAQSIN